MSSIDELQKSLAKAEAELRRARKAYSTCLLNDPTGCGREQEAVAAAETRVGALERRIEDARRVEEARLAEALRA